MEEKQSFLGASAGILIVNLLLGIPGGIGLAILSRYLEESFAISFASIAVALAFMVMTFHVLMKGLASPVCGYWADSKGRKYTALMGCILIIIFASLATFLMTSPIIIFVIILLLSGSSSFLRSTIESTWTDVSDPSNRGKTYGVFRFFNELGGVIHPLIMTLLLFLAVPIYFSAILVAIFAVISYVIGRKYFKETLEL